MTTYLQTVLVYRPNSPWEFTTEALRPVPPPALQKTLNTSNRPVGLLRIDGTRIFWWRGGHVTMTEKDGTERVFWPKPTRGDAVEHALAYPRAGSTFQFFADGSVTARCFGGIYYYGPEVAGLSEEGQELHAVYEGGGAWGFCPDCVTGCSARGGAECETCYNNTNAQRTEEYEDTYSDDDSSEYDRCSYCNWKEGTCRC